jgi:deoxyribonuclease V
VDLNPITVCPVAISPEKRKTLVRAERIQQRLRRRVIRANRFETVRRVAGIDVAYGGNRACAAVVVFRFPEIVEIEVAVAVKRDAFDYVPGFFSLREAPVMIRALVKLDRPPDLLLVDGHGRAHPRCFGLACHLGVLVDLPTIGCAKTRLVGAFREPLPESGHYSPLFEGPNLLGAVVRTRKNVRPLFVSTGHRIDLTTAVAYVLACCRGYRLPEPLRRAHQVARITLRSSDGAM